MRTNGVYNERAHHVIRNIGFVKSERNSVVSSTKLAIEHEILFTFYENFHFQNTNSNPDSRVNHEFRAALYM